jgi:hypothetical protein
MCALLLLRPIYLILVPRRGLHNFMHPRTDAVVITVAIDHSGHKILLGKNVRACSRFLILTLRH